MLRRALSVCVHAALAAAGAVIPAGCTGIASDEAMEDPPFALPTWAPVPPAGSGTDMPVAGAPAPMMAGSPQPMQPMQPTAGTGAAGWNGSPPPPPPGAPQGIAGRAQGGAGWGGDPNDADAGSPWPTGPTAPTEPSGPVGFSASEVALYGTLSPLLALPADPTNAVADEPAAVALGRELFLDEQFSGPLKVASALGPSGASGRVSCATCHFGPALNDPAPVSTGTDVGTRNSLSLINGAYQRWSNWGGRFSAQWELPIAVVENPAIMNGTRLRVAHRIYDAHRAAYETVFGPLPAELGDVARFPYDGKPKPAPTSAVPEPADGPWETMTPADRDAVNAILVHYGKAIAAFTRTLVSRQSRFDAFVQGDSSALDPSEQAGLRLFIGKARCIVCHNGPLFSDGAFHNLGVPPLSVGSSPDDGRFKDIPPLLASPFNSAGSWSDDAASGRLAGLTNPPPEDTRGQFRTASLRGVALSPPYMHSGALPDLRAVIEFYNWGGGMPASGTRDRQLVPLHLTEQEVAELEAFLRSLTGEPVDGTLTVGERPMW